jgi:branched-chain amino acid aminotransferase
MVNFDGTLTQNPGLSPGNRAFLYGDGVFETLKIIDGRILFFEDHYFRLMASMRILRMEIPMHFTMEFLLSETLKLTDSIGCTSSARARLVVFRREGGFYLPANNGVSFIISAEPLSEPLYKAGASACEVDIYKDFHISAQLLSTLKSVGRTINVTGSIFAAENGLDNCLLLNEHKNVVEALNGNLFLLSGSTLATPPLADGCLNGIMRKQVLALARKFEGLEVEERSISPFELQQADEMFITNVIKGLKPITKFRKKTYGVSAAQALTARLNAGIRLG